MIRGPRGRRGADGVAGTPGADGDPTVASADRGSANDAVFTGISYAIGTRKAGVYELWVLAYNLATNQASSFGRRATVRRGVAGAPVLVGAVTDLETKDEAGGDVDMSVDGSGNLVCSGMGVAAASINWNFRLYFKAGFE